MITTLAIDGERGVGNEGIFWKKPVNPPNPLSLKMLLNKLLKNKNEELTLPLSNDLLGHFIPFVDSVVN
jgi:hypothetical protein